MIKKYIKLTAIIDVDLNSDTNIPEEEIRIIITNQDVDHFCVRSKVAEDITKTLVENEG